MLVFEETQSNQQQVNESVKSSLIEQSSTHVGDPNFITESVRIHETLAKNSSSTNRFSLKKENLSKLEKLLVSEKASDQLRAAQTLKAMGKIQNMVVNEAIRNGISENTAYSNFGALAPQVFDMVAIYYPNVIAHDICDIQQVMNPRGVVYKVLSKASQTRNGLTKGDTLFKSYSTSSYASEEQYDTSAIVGNGSTTTFNYVLPVLPVRPGTFFLQIGSVAGTDTGVNGATTGQITGSGISSGSINYVTGAVSITFSTAPAVGASFVQSWNASHEANPNIIPEVQIDVEHQPYEVDSYPLKTNLSVQARLTAETTLNLNLSESLATTAGSFIKNERDNKLVRLLNAKAASSASLNFDCSNGSNYSKIHRFSEFAIKIDEASNIIRQQSGRGHVDFIVCGLNAYNVISKSSTFEPVAAPELPMVGSYRAGTIDGRIPVIKVTNNLILDTNSYIFGFKGMQAGDSSMIIADFVPLYFTQEVTLNLNTSRGVLTMYDLLQGNNNYLVKGTLQNYVA